jgi:hypothetical protein
MTYKSVNAAAGKNWEINIPLTDVAFFPIVSPHKAAIIKNPHFPGWYAWSNFCWRSEWH